MKKIVKLALSLAIASTAFVAALAVNANAESVSLVYDEVNSTSQTAYVSLVTDVASVPSYEVTIGAETAKIASFEVVEALAGMNHNITTADQAAVAVNADGQLLTTAYVSGEAATVPASGVIWTLKITFTEALSADDTLAWLDYSYVEGGDGEWIDSDTMTASCTVLANPNAGSGEVDTRSDFEAATAEKIGTFDADTTTVPVAAWIAEIDYSAVKIADGASLVWKVDTATVDTVSGTTVSGEGSVFYGLAIAGRADQLSTIETVQLVAE